MTEFVPSPTSSIDPTKCAPNKFQPATRRTFTDADLADLESIKEHGLYYPIIVHRDQASPEGHYIVQDGWRRVSAWLRWRPGELIPAEIKPLPPTDRELFETSVITNEGRQNLNAIQKADLLAQAIELGMTQAQAGALFNPPIKQAAVSHLLSLRKLPPEIKVFVESGAIPERIARQLITLAKHAPDKAITAAQEIAKVQEGEKDTAAQDEIDQAYRDTFPTLRTWDASYRWPLKPKDVSKEAKPDKGEPTTITSCTDCSFPMKFNFSTYCTRPACYHLKQRLIEAKHKAEMEKLKADKNFVTDADKPGSSAKGTASVKAQREIEHAKREQESVAARALLAAAIELISPKLPDLPEPYLSFLMHTLDEDSMFDDDNAPDWLQKLTQTNRHDLDTLKSADKSRMVKALMICERVWGWSDRPADVRTNIEKLAAEWKGKLPKSWAESANVAKPTKAAMSKKRQAK